MYLLSPHSVMLYATVWLIAALWHFIFTRNFKISHFKFSIFNFYVMMSPFVLASIVASSDTGSWKPILYFCGFALAGVIGETLISIWWRLYFTNRFWVYQVETVDHSYTSWLNFIPWGVGGIIYFNTLTRFISEPSGTRYASLWIISLVAVIVLFILQRALLRLALREQERYRTLTVMNFVLFFWPIVAFVALLAYLFGPEMYVLACIFGVVATSAEYLFGKSTEFFISKKLWRYNYLSFDNGHFTPLSLPLFALGGFYFWSVAQMLHLMIG